MNNGFGVTHIVSQLSFAGPSLLVFLFAAVMALIYMSRAKAASILTLIGALISIFSIIGFIAVQTYVLTDNSLIEQRAMILQVLGVAGSTVRAVGLAFLVGAIFVGRNSPTMKDRYLED